MFYIMRHGKTDWNERHRLQGSTDIPLNEEGRQMARDARTEYKDLSFDVCYCSPLLRARQTAEIFLEKTNTPIIFDNRLKEMSFGDFEGIENCFEKPECPIYKLFKDPVNYVAVEHAEEMEHLYARTGAFIEEVLKPEIAKGKKVLIVGHGAMNCSLINQVKDTPIEDFWRYMTGNCKLQEIDE